MTEVATTTAAPSEAGVLAGELAKSFGQMVQLYEMFHDMNPANVRHVSLQPMTEVFMLTKINDFHNPVHEMVVDYQMAYQGGNGLMRLYEFDFTRNKIDVASFSPWVVEKPKDSLKQFDRAWLTEPNHEFSIDIDFQRRFSRFTHFCHLPAFAGTPIFLASSSMRMEYSVSKIAMPVFMGAPVGVEGALTIGERPERVKRASFRRRRGSSSAGLALQNSCRVASAATASALPASQTLKSKNGFPGICNPRNCSILYVGGDTTVIAPHSVLPASVPVILYQIPSSALPGRRFGRP